MGEHAQMFDWTVEMALGEGLAPYPDRDCGVVGMSTGVVVRAVYWRKLRYAVRFSAKVENFPGCVSENFLEKRDPSKRQRH